MADRLDNDLAVWSNKSQASKGGTVLHNVRYGEIRKSCGHMMGTKCGCSGLSTIKELIEKLEEKDANPQEAV